MTHEERLELAGRLRDLIVRRYGDNVLAVFVTSSTARGLDLEFSDLELTAVHRDGTAPASRSYYYRGMLVEVEHIEESRILDQRVRRQWPISAGEYRGRIVLHENDRWTEHLDAVLDARDAADPMTAQRMALLEVLEYRDKLRNARLIGDETSLRAFGFFLVDGAANFVLFLNRQAMITTRLYFHQALGCAEVPPGFRAAVETLLGLRRADPQTIAATAEGLTAGLVELAARRGLEVQSDELLV